MTSSSQNLNNLNIHKVNTYKTWKDNYNQTNGIGENDLIIIPPSFILPRPFNNSTGAISNGSNGQFLQTDGSGGVSWATVDALPSQTGHSGEFLKSNNGTAEWASIPQTDISGKTDKVSNATNGNFAALDSSGNLTDSGHTHSDYVIPSQLNSYMLKSTYDSNGNGIVDNSEQLGGYSASHFATVETINNVTKVTSNLLTSRIVNVTLMDGDSLTLDNTYKNATINVHLVSTGGTASIIVPDDVFEVGDEFEVFITKSDSSITETLTITRASGAQTKFNNNTSVSLSDNLGIAVLKCYSITAAPEGQPYDDYLSWLVKGDIQ